MSWSSPVSPALEGCLAIAHAPLLDSKVGIVFNTDKVVSFLTEISFLLFPLPSPSLKPPPCVEQVVILRTSTHNLFPVSMLVVSHSRGVD